MLQQRANGAACGKYRQRVAAQAPQCPRHVDTAATGFKFGRGAAQLMLRHNLVDGSALVYRGVQGERNYFHRKRIRANCLLENAPANSHYPFTDLWAPGCAMPVCKVS